MSRMVSFLVLVAILIVIGVLFFRVMSAFMVPLFLAALLVVVFQPLYRWILEKCRGQRYIAAGLTTLAVLLIVLIPAGLVIGMGTAQGLAIVEQLEVTDVRTKLRGLRQEFDLEIPWRDDLDRMEDTIKRWKNEQVELGTPSVNPEMVDNLVGRLKEIQTPDDGPADERPTGDTHQLAQALTDLGTSQPFSIERDQALKDVDASFRRLKGVLLGGSGKAWLKELVNPSDDQIADLRNAFTARAGSPLLSFGSGTVAIVGKLLIGLLIVIAALFFLFAEGSRMLDAAIRLSPLEERYVRELAGEFDRVCRAVVSATLLSAVAQGILAGIGFYFAGMQESVALLMLLAMVLAMVPFLGTASVWVPVSLYLYFVDDRPTAAILLAVYGTVVISGADNLIKPIVLHGQSNLHPLLALLSVIGGLQSLGPIGILVGPMVVVFLQTLLKILQRELLSLDRGEGTAGIFAFLRPPTAAVSPSVATMAAAAAAVVPAPSEAAGKATPSGNGNAGSSTNPPNKKRRK
jgi:predicted PurR-regulated permease PerM